MMRPQVTKRGTKLHLRYTLKQRIFCSYTHPRPAPDGKSVIICGTETGLSILWRGDIDTVKEGAHEEQSLNKPYEADPECPYPDIATRVDVDIERAVLRIASPAPLIHGHIPAILHANILVAVVYANGTSQLLNIPLASPSAVDEPEYIQYVKQGAIDLQLSASPSYTLTAKIVAAEDLNPSFVKLDDDAWGMLVVAVGSTFLGIHRLAIYEDSIVQIENGSRLTWELPAPSTSASWHTSSRSLQLLIGDVTGAVRIFDPQAVAARSRPSSRDSAMAGVSESGTSGKWLFAYHSTFTAADTGVTRRKQILDVAWIHGGAGILFLLEDGEWGVWDVMGASTARSSCTFAIRGYVGSTPTVDTGDSRSRRGGARLAPMTPNTRKAKAEKLFSGPSKTPGLASSGRIAVFARDHARGTTADETAWLWYNGDVYNIASVSALWQRGINQSSSAASLQSPNLLHAVDLDVLNEDVTSVGQLPMKSSALSSSGSGDLLVTTEHRIIILHSIRVLGPAKVLFQQATEQASRNQRMLDAGELDLGGMDRMLDDMTSNEAMTRPRKVGFVH